MKKKATIKDVAKYANVSISTVSNAINNIDKALEEAGIPVNEKIIFESDITWEAGYNTGHRIIKSNDEITVAVATADIVAFGIIKALKEAGKEALFELPDNSTQMEKDCLSPIMI